MEPRNKMSNVHKVCFSDVDFQNRMKISAILGYFQEIAHEHAYNLGVGYETLLDKSVVWVLSRIRVEISENLCWQQGFSIETWPQKPTRINAERDFVLKKDNGDVCVKGISQWVVMDINTRKLITADSLDYNFKDFLPERAIGDYKFKKLRLDGNLIKECVREVKAGDIDMNGHLNNIKYVDYVYDCFSVEELKQYSLNAIEVNYLSEVSEGDSLTIKIYLSTGEKVMYSEGTGNTGNPVFRTRIEFI